MNQSSCGSAQKRLREPEFFSEACIDRTGRHEAPQLAQEGRLSGRRTAHAPWADRGFDNGVRHGVRLGRRFHAVDDGTRRKRSLPIIVGDLRDGLRRIDVEIGSRK